MSFLKKVVKDVSSSVKKDATKKPSHPSAPSTPAAREGKPTSIALPESHSTSQAHTETGGRTPHTPADEGIAFFEGAVSRSEGPIQVWQLDLEPDGSPTKDKSVSPLNHAQRRFGHAR